MKITFLGTGTSQGVPVIACHCETCLSNDPHDTRLRSSVHIETNNISLVIDTGPDFRQQMLMHNIQKLDAVLLTHEHKDHVGGLDDIRAFNFVQNKAMDVYASDSVHKAIKREFNYAFAREKYPGVPQIQPHVIRNKPFHVMGMEITPVQVTHYYLKVFGFRMGNFAYLTDVSSIHPREIKKLKNLDTLVINALRKKIHYSHYNLAQALELIDVVRPKNAYLTHISHMMGKQMDVEKELPPHIKFGYDGLCLHIK